jgi:hypothetical protein
MEMEIVLWRERNVILNNYVFRNMEEEEEEVLLPHLRLDLRQEGIH